MLNFRLYICAFALIIADLAAWAIAFKITTSGYELNINTILMALWTFWVLFENRNYFKRQSFWVELKGLFLGALIFCTFSVIAGVLYEQYQAFYFYSKLALLLMIGLPLIRFVTRRALDFLKLWSIPTIVFGVKENAKQAVLALESDSNLGFRVEAILAPTGEKFEKINGINVKPWPNNKEDFQWLKDKHCVIALEGTQGNLRDSIIRKLSDNGVSRVSVIPAMRGVPLYGLDTTQFFSHEVLMISLRIQLGRPILRAIKRIFDIIFSSLLLLFLSPVIAYIAYMVSKDGGSAYYGHERIGRNGKKFKCYKFRSMVQNSKEVLEELLNSDPNARSEWEKDFKLKNDPRVTKIGKLLRRTSLDELPQLWNVFTGEMSLVGPRPIVYEELQRYGEDVIYYLMTNPGMTGLWQISGRNDLEYSTRVYFDAWYVENWSLWTDIAILFKTVSVVFGRKGAY